MTSSYGYYIRKIQQKIKASRKSPILVTYALDKQIV